jgi:hypothetical protein
MLNRQPVATWRVRAVACLAREGTAAYLHSFWLRLAEAAACRGHAATAVGSSYERCAPERAAKAALRAAKTPFLARPIVLESPWMARYGVQISFSHIARSPTARSVLDPFRRGLGGFTRAVRHKTLGVRRYRDRGLVSSEYTFRALSGCEYLLGVPGSLGGPSRP